MRRVLYATLGIAIGLSACVAQADKPSKAAGLKRVTQKLVRPPGVPVHDQVAKGDPKIVEVRLVVLEQKMVIDPQ